MTKNDQSTGETISKLRITVTPNDNGRSNGTENTKF